jgi:hypothetical protein
MDLADTKFIENGSSVEYRISGTLEAVLNAVRGLFREYPAEGYGTTVKHLGIQNYTSYTALVWRARSCD